MGAKHPWASKIGKTRFPITDPILPADITRLTAIALILMEDINLILNTEFYV